MTGSIAEERLLLVDGRRRSLTVIAPSVRSQQSAAMLVFHGSNQTGKSFRAFTGHTFERMAEREGIVLAFLDGYRRHWNDARASITFAARTENVDDVAFTSATIDLLGSDYDIDPGRILAAGFSNGGQLVIRLAHEMPEALAGIAIMSATQPEEHNFQPAKRLVRPLPTITFHGTRDPIVPYEGGLASMWGIAPRGLGLSAAETARNFAVRNGISAEPSHRALDLPGASRTSIRRTDYRQDGRPPVSLITVEGGGHVAPSPKHAPRIMGRSTDRLIAADEISSFFRAEPQP